MWARSFIRAASVLVCATALLGGCSSSADRPDGSLPPSACAINNGGCDLNAICLEEPDGGTTCECLPGYVDTGDACVSPGDCSANGSVCDPNATCVTSNGASSCVCNLGYTGDGMTCTAATGACATNNGGCDPNASCQDGNGTALCTCNTGYTGDGTTCSPVSSGGGSCATNNGGCDSNATCNDGASGVTCTCNVGFQGDGMTCRPAPVGGLGSPCSGSNMGNQPVQGSCPLGEDCLAISPMNMCTVVGCQSNNDCGTNGVLPNICTQSAGVTFCLLSCDPNMSDPCGRSDFVCYAATTSTGAVEHVCVPKCTLQPGICPYPQQCDTSTDQCATVPCGQNNSCPADQVCYTPPSGGNACVPDCRVAGNSCPSGSACNDTGGCDAIPMQQAYQPCGGSNGMCAPGLGCIQDMSSGVAVCMKQCNSNADCPGNNEGFRDCGIQLNSGQQYCDDTCLNGTPCPGGTTCTDPATDNNGAPFCLP